MYAVKINIEFFCWEFEIFNEWDRALLYFFVGFTMTLLIIKSFKFSFNFL